MVYLFCKPSSVILDKPYEFLLESLNTLTYKKTLDKLRELYDKVGDKTKFPLMQKIRVSKNKIVGIITNTNQLILVNPTSKNKEKLDKDLLIVDENEDIYNDYELDNIIQDNDSVTDVERKETIRKIKLESNFYVMFRNTFRIKKNMLELILTQYKYDEKKEIIDYTKKMDKLIEKMQKLLEKNKKYIKFNNFKNLNIDDIFMCLGLDDKSCNKTVNCSFSEENDGICTILLPKKNILSSKDNSKMYYVKLADELIRYSYIRNYVFTNNTFLSFEPVKYDIDKKEIILLEELLNNLFESDISIDNKANFSINNNLYDTTNPSMVISNTFSRKELESKYLKEESPNVKKLKKKITLPVVKEKEKKSIITNVVDVILDKSVKEEIKETKEVIKVSKKDTKNKRKSEAKRIKETKRINFKKAIDWLKKNKLKHTDITGDLLYYVKKNCEKVESSDWKKFVNYIKLRKKNTIWYKFIKHYEDENEKKKNSIQSFYVKLAIKYMNKLNNIYKKPLIIKLSLSEPGKSKLYYDQNWKEQLKEIKHISKEELELINVYGQELLLTSEQKSSSSGEKKK